jgi:flavin reductase (DIM6/NTAB) family NADH-FMN oxidoreductase RutF
VIAAPFGLAMASKELQRGCVRIVRRRRFEINRFIQLFSRGPLGGMVMKFDPAQLSAKDCHSLLVCAVLPRPIAFVSTIGPDGIPNLAPFSYFTVMSSKPAVVGFGIGRKRDGGKKDTLVNVESIGDFVINVVTEELAEAMNQTAGEYPPHVDEFKEAGLTALASDRVKSPRVGESPVNLECKLMQILNFGEAPRISSFIIGEILQVHLHEEIAVGCVAKGDRLRAIGRLGEDFYCRTQDFFEMKRPVV